MSTCTAAAGRRVGGRVGFLSLLLPRDTSDERARLLLRELVGNALKHSGESLAEFTFEPAHAGDDAAMRRWFVEYETSAPARPTTAIS